MNKNHDRKKGGKKTLISSKVTELEKEKLVEEKGPNWTAGKEIIVPWWT